MSVFSHQCIRIVGEKIACPYCTGVCIRYGKNPAGEQRYRCKGCRKSFVRVYKYAGCQPQINNRISTLTCEGCGIRSISSVLKISMTTVLSKIRTIASKIRKPLIAIGKEYEVDEIRTYCKLKERKVWIVYALRRDTKEVVDFAVGRRTLKTLGRVTNTLQLSGAERIYTDKLPHYKTLISKGVHQTKAYGTNSIERRNLTLRTHLKRLQRKTICFTRSISMLISCLKISFWRVVN